MGAAAKITWWSAMYTRATSFSVLSSIREIREMVTSRGLLVGVIRGGWAGNRTDRYEKSSRLGLSPCGVGERIVRENGGDDEAGSGEAAVPSDCWSGDDERALGVEAN